ncbi:MAG: DUF4145 domain-containing protein [Dehalococcoidia bacterium]
MTVIERLALPPPQGPMAMICPPPAGPVIHEWRLVPPSDAKAFPDYIPAQIRIDYTEACLIRDLSPRGSATLARRCLQGMVRDFWGVTGKDNLYQEIQAIKDKVDPLVWKAIDAVRSVGNIGAHMENDINLIVDVDPGEANQMIGLIEVLMKEWYIHRHEREQQMSAIVAVADTKRVARASEKRGASESQQS